MARRTPQPIAGAAVERFVKSRILDDGDDGPPSTVIISVRVEAQTVGDLEDLAGRLDISRSMLARRLIETGLEDAEAAYESFHAGGNG